MKITKVSVNRKFNLGNYETLDMAAEAELNEKDNPLEVWNIIRDNIEMCFTDMQRPKPKPVQPEHPKPSPFKRVEQQKQEAPKDTGKDGTICPSCGGNKKPGYEICYNCHEAEKAQ